MADLAMNYDPSTLDVPPPVKPRKLVTRTGAILPSANVSAPATPDPVQVADNMATGTMTDAGPAEAGTIDQPPQVPLGRRVAEGLKSGIDTGMDVVSGINRIVSAPGRAIVGAVGNAANAVGQFGKDFFNVPDTPVSAPVSIAVAPKVAPAAAAPVTAQQVVQPNSLLGAQSGTITTPPTIATAPPVTTPAAIARIAQPAPMIAPTKASLGPLPTLGEAPNQNIFSAMTQLGRDNAAYRDKAGLNAQAQSNFNNLDKASTYNLDAMAKTAAANAGIGTENRANLAQPPAIEHQKAQTDLYKEQTAAAKQAAAEKGKVADLRQKMMDETDPAKRRSLENQLYAIQGKPQPKYQIVTEKGVASDGITPTQTSHIVMEDQYGNPITKPIVGPGVGKQTLPPGMTRQVGTSGGKPVYEDAQGKRFAGK